MKRGIVVEGDPLSSGGKVVKGTGTLVAGKYRVALLGDPVTCPIIGHGSGTVVEGDPKFQMNNKPAALEGHKASCGCTLLAKLVGQKMQIDDSHPTLKDGLDKYCEERSIGLIKKKIKNPILDKITLALDLFCLQKEILEPAKTPDKSIEQNKMVYKPLPGMPKDFVCEENLGGAHRNTKNPPKDGYESHHMPPKSAYKGSKMYPPGAKTSMNGPAIKMTKADHGRTQSHGSGEKATEYQEMQKKLVQEGRFKESLQNDIDDLRRIAAENGKPDQFECQIKQVIEYSNKLDPGDFIIK